MQSLTGASEAASAGPLDGNVLAAASAVIPASLGGALGPIPELSTGLADAGGTGPELPAAALVAEAMATPLAEGRALGTALLGAALAGAWEFAGGLLVSGLGSGASPILPPTVQPLSKNTEGASDPSAIQKQRTIGGQPTTGLGTPQA